MLVRIHLPVALSAFSLLHMFSLYFMSSTKFKQLRLVPSPKSLMQIANSKFQMHLWWVGQVVNVRSYRWLVVKARSDQSHFHKYQVL